MKNKNNKNAFAGMNIEILIKNSIIDHPAVIEKMKNKFNIQGSLSNTAGGGIYGDKSDVRINFTCGHYIDANVKGFRDNVGFNQLTRTSVSKFCDDFALGQREKVELENIIVAKSKNTRNVLFSQEQQEKWGVFFAKNAKGILKYGFANNPSREILVLYNRDTSVVKIYAMKDVLNSLPTNIVFTKGGFNIGCCVAFQRKGGNGSLSKDIPKTNIRHPGNNIQLKLKVHRIIDLLEPVKLAEYAI
ncbi:MAG: hypothetical protein LBR69_02885 [Endomicrobium sp.]|jgi:hypothetical protein|nr:hypothetical protein [Endomicrobium sp.]